MAAANAARGDILLTGIAGLIAGAMSMAAGEYVSVSSQSDTESADITRDTRELLDDPDAELNELTGIYLARGLTPELARQVAEQLTSKDALAAHSRDELHLSDVTAARPVQAALTSAATFGTGAALPLLIVMLVPAAAVVIVVTAASLLFLALLGAVGARAGGRGDGQGGIKSHLLGRGRHRLY